MLKYLKKLRFRFTSWRIGTYIRIKHPDMSYVLKTCPQEHGYIAVHIRVYAIWGSGFGDSWIEELKDGIRKNFKVRDVKIIFSN